MLPRLSPGAHLTLPFVAVAMVVVNPVAGFSLVMWDADKDKARADMAIREDLSTKGIVATPTVLGAFDTCIQAEISTRTGHGYYYVDSRQKPFRYMLVDYMDHDSVGDEEGCLALATNQTAVLISTPEA